MRIAFESEKIVGRKREKGSKPEETGILQAGIKFMRTLIFGIAPNGHGAPQPPNPDLEIRECLDEVESLVTRRESYHRICSQQQREMNIPPVEFMQEIILAQLTALAGDVRDKAKNAEEDETLLRTGLKSVLRRINQEKRATRGQIARCKVCPCFREVA